MSHRALACGVALAAVSMIVCWQTSRAGDRGIVRDNHGVARYTIGPDPARPDRDVVRGYQSGLPVGTIERDPTYVGRDDRYITRDNKGLETGTFHREK